MLQSIGDFNEMVRTAIDNVISNVVEGFLNIVNSVVELPSKIFDKMQELFEFFFVPDPDLMDERFNTLRSQFAFIDSIMEYGEHLGNFLQTASGTSAPVITIDLSKAGGSYSWGSRKISFSFFWYADYKPLVDNLVAGIIWAKFLWHMYKRIPELIHGQGMVADKSIDISRRV